MLKGFLSGAVIGAVISVVGLLGTSYFTVEDGAPAPQDLAEAAAPQDPPTAAADAEEPTPLAAAEPAADAAMPPAMTPADAPAAEPAPAPAPQQITLPAIAPSTPAPAPAPAPAPIPVPEDLPALVAHGAAFAAPADQSLLGILLFDDPEFPLTDSTLQSLNLPVSIVIDPARMDAAAQVARYRAAGFEAVIEARFADAAAFDAALDALSGTVALVDTVEGTLRSDLALQSQVLARLGQTGHGLVAGAFGLGGLEQAATREDVPVSRVYRILDDEGQSAPTMVRLLDRAGFEAAQSGSAIVLGRSYPETIAALLSWGEAQGRAAYQVAPVSAILQRVSAP